jgi:L-amino acid N-acyltransferase YncA
MNIIIREFTAADLPDMIRIWNQVVEDGIAFPQEKKLDAKTGAEFFADMTYCGVAENTADGQIAGLYILHPNNVGRVGHIANASYAVDADFRGAHIGEKLVTDCLQQAARAGFRIMQFNAVVKTNLHARHLYERLGFHELGTIPGGFLMKDGHFEDICLYYKELEVPQERKKTDSLSSSSRR